jgi:hypothetical protein
MADPRIKELAYDALAATLGAPVDLFAAALRPLGYRDQPVLGSQFIRQRLPQRETPAIPSPMPEFTRATMASEIPQVDEFGRVIRQAQTPERRFTPMERVVGAAETAESVLRGVAGFPVALVGGVAQGIREGDVSAKGLEGRMSSILQNLGYTPKTEAGREMLGQTGEFFERLETEYKLPPIGGAPSAAPLLGVRGVPAQVTTAVAEELATPPRGAIGPIQESRKFSDLLKTSLPSQYDDVTQLPIPKEFGGVKTEEYLFHGGIKGDLSTKGYDPYLQGAARVDDIVPTSFSQSPQEALEYTTIAGGDMVAIPKSSLNLYKGGNEGLTNAALQADLQTLKNAGFDGVDLREIRPGGYREVLVWGLDKVSDKALYAPVGVVDGNVGIKNPLKKLPEPPKNIEILPNVEVDVAPAIKTKNFQNWFGESKITDDSGNPLVVYHGTSRSFDTFKTKDGAFFTGDEGWANYHAQKSIEFRGGKGEERVVPVYLKMENPLVLDGRNPEVNKDYISNYETFQKEAKKAGHDGLIIKNSEGGTEYVVFKPTQIKSATENIGTFDPKNPKITRGAIVAPIGTIANEEEEEVE